MSVKQTNESKSLMGHDLHNNPSEFRSLIDFAYIFA
jgi:hypothetical protein